MNSFKYKYLPYAEAEHDARRMCGDPQALAFEWIKGYAANLSEQCGGYGDDDGEPDVSVNELISVAKSQLDTESSWGGDYIIRGGVFEGTHTDPVFWDKLAILLDEEIPPSKRNNFFSCAC